MKDKDFLRSKFMAEAFLPFSEIPDTEPETDFTTLEQVHLKLSRPTKQSKYYKRNKFFLLYFKNNNSYSYSLIIIIFNIIFSLLL